ncbi:MAG: hypothetical protein COV07_04350 [Candidatus Vogelbacteria bacterium CG10_big_fil_rev_8_21_14_0_10_45_14]|uniref:Uncharacterized protein n=1 Tax=Candidatus Vogelbacteria bacterium CG10_big_fil_rev_8_21_14_0_10_45_14 TaxID=1975042 RepID=A0A2H0RIB3_9BACT|nr:MAG: hypothetical protein COV07_04350 [Candidatus Vogelbacteria bacterium CG10_big_fil_rev_8_21_14_0_10_45_14]
MDKNESKPFKVIQGERGEKSITETEARVMMDSWVSKLSVDLSAEILETKGSYDLERLTKYLTAPVKLLCDNENLCDIGYLTILESFDRIIIDTNSKWSGQIFLHKGIESKIEFILSSRDRLKLRVANLRASYLLFSLLKPEDISLLEANLCKKICISIEYSYRFAKKQVPAAWRSKLEFEDMLETKSPIELSVKSALELVQEQTKLLKTLQGRISGEERNQNSPHVSSFAQLKEIGAKLEMLKMRTACLKSNLPINIYESTKDMVLGTTPQQLLDDIIPKEKLSNLHQ